MAANFLLNNWQSKTEVRSNGLWSKSGWLAIWPHAPLPVFFETKPEKRPEGATALFPVTTMDEDLSTTLLLRVDWLKFDVEGCEVEILRGARELVNKFRPQILVENHLFKDKTIKDQFGKLLLEICPRYQEVGTMPYGQVSHTFWSAGFPQTYSK